MGSPHELTLDYKPNHYSSIQKSFVDQADHTHKLEDFLARLEEERLKIEAFKRELPLCMQLLNNAMETYKQQLESCQSTQGVESRPVLEEFIPIKHMNAEGDGKPPNPNPASEKANWMVSVQLWNPASDASKQDATKEAEKSFNLGLDSKQRNGGAFLPFAKEKGQPRVTDLALASPEKQMESGNCSEVRNGEMEAARSENRVKGDVAEQGKGGSSSTDGQPATAQTNRKARRCWSPDLHRRFVDALRVLGGSQVATPKQIRELMKVDGLTNDEVKSHLQKYRLHTRRPMAPQPPTAASAPQLLVLGGIWVPPEYATSAGAVGSAIYSGGGGAAPIHYCGPPPEFYSAAAASQSAAAHYQFHAAAHYKARLGSPESAPRSGGESAVVEEEEEDEEGTEEDDKSAAGRKWDGEEMASGSAAMMF